ncbi:hypothetical protein BO83DRAFT_75370 [Aspergillus eucalypticola CBS 122712]|uniref:Uncharacterized protein n=1 Tax=Aspergillus eucalypticola (strain CBS 122712 / IBT 29274) TaxID=1448314 RepID=A0A317V707_ASPEC|nr:uncharacterized protein BO83DRAFT_75370 [Aspergillus eucalypticola CBS 122712]PWY68848.1 hypothetical protein BO83DRAFT_75370 [Aspergillus eucalypticola CBS 122712]
MSGCKGLRDQWPSGSQSRRERTDIREMPPCARPRVPDKTGRKSSTTRNVSRKPLPLLCIQPHLRLAGLGLTSGGHILIRLLPSASANQNRGTNGTRFNQRRGRK